MASDSSSLVPIAQVVGLTGSALLSGQSIPCPHQPGAEEDADSTVPAGLIGAISYISIPSLAPLPATQAAQVWKRTYDIGVATAPPFAVTCAVSFAFLASQSPPSSASSFLGLSFSTLNARTLYAAATLALPAIVPYTIITMRPINDKLMLKAKDGEKASVNDEETREFLAQWRRLNFGRAVIVLVGSLIGCVAAVVVR